mmetsp:Transcript_4769/g.14425  ORF Transcript_4769/g.14425 Transcript_4769/m.14425 type:complete len:320 (+) Transcript_4769:64-1023(+)
MRKVVLVVLQVAWLGRSARLFVTERGDGPGATVHSILYALGVAARYGMEFGGVQRRVREHISHSINITHFATRVFGVPVFVGQVPLHTKSIPSVEKLDELFDTGQLERDADYLLKTGSMVKGAGLEGLKARRNVTLDEFITPNLIDAFRAPWTAQAIDTPKAGMAIHVRRGTLHKSLTADSYFLALIDVFRQETADTPVHVYSLRDSRPFVGFDTFPYADKQGVIFHLDAGGHDEDHLLDIWAHFAQTTVMVVDTSSFSWVPSFFNRNCVIYHPYRIHGMPDRLAPSRWVPSDDRARVRACIRDSLLHQAATRRRAHFK